MFDKSKNPLPIFFILFSPRTVVAMKNGGLTNELALKRMESFLAENKHLGPYHYLRVRQ